MKNLRSLLEEVDNNYQAIKEQFSEKEKQVRNLQSKEELILLNGAKKVEQRLDQLSINPETNPIELERIIGENHLMNLSYFEEGLRVAKTVCRIIYSDGQDKQAIGTGFLVGPNLLMTNNHVLKNEKTAKQFLAEFDFEKKADGTLKTTTLFEFTPEVFFITNRHLDYTIVALHSVASNQAQKKLETYGWNKLKASGAQILEGERVSIIQHPEGLPKMLAIRENKIVKIHASFLHYTSDTQRGSSGAPVANDQWEIIGLHRSGVAEKNENGFFLLKKGGIWKSEADDPLINWVANQGILMDDILIDIADQPMFGSKENLKKSLLEHFHPPLAGSEYKLPKQKR